MSNPTVSFVAADDCMEVRVGTVLDYVPHGNYDDHGDSNE